MSYQALYRKWRPEKFGDVVGQDAIVTTLIHQITSGRIPHAYLFCGSRGTGKTSTAKVLARAINCAHPGEGAEPCGVCEACRQLARENNLDVVEIDAASNNGVDEIRDLREKVKYPPSVGRYRVYIIDEVHMLSTGAFNALLKTLEEPPAHVVFILATTEPQKLPATILSRCQRFDFKRIPAGVIVERLKRVADTLEVQAEPEALEWIARSAEGGMRDALSLMDMCLSYGGEALTAQVVREVLGASDRSFLFEFAGCLLAGDTAGALQRVDQLMREGRDVAVFLKEISGHLRALMVAQVCSSGLEELLEITGEDAERYRRQAGEARPAQLMRLLDLFLRAEGDLKWASQSRVVLELAAVRACHPERELELEAMAQRLEQLEQAVKEGAVKPRPAAARPARAQEVRPEAASSSAPAQPAAPAGGDQECYQAALKGVRKASMAVYSPLSRGRFGGVNGDAVTLVFPKGGEIYVKMLERDAAKQCLEEQFTQAFGRPVTLSLSMEGAQPAPGTPPRQVLGDLFDAFGRDKVEVIDD